MKDDVLTIHSPFGVLKDGMTAYLNWEKDETFQLKLIPGQTACFDSEAFAFENELLYFQLNSQGDVISFTMPGYFYGVVVPKIN